MLWFRSLVAVCAVLASAAVAGAQTRPGGGEPRLRGAITDARTIALPGNIHPSLVRAARSEPVDGALRLEGLLLTLRPSPEQETALEELLARQSDAASPDFHKFLTPEEFGARFGASAEEIAAVTGWLESRGLTVEEVPPGGRVIVFGGYAGQVAGAFGTELRRYRIDGVEHVANAGDPRIPEALAPLIGGIVKLHDFRHGAYSARTAEAVPLRNEATPEYAPGGARWLTPGDYHVLYNIKPLLNAALDGTGVSIGVIARSNIFVSDVRSFRSLFGLAANDPQVVLTTADPGKVSGDVLETTLDTEWAGAVAPKAAVKVIVAASSTFRDGIDSSSLYAVTRNVAPVLTVSYGSCEIMMGAAEMSFYHSLWQQASAQGQTVLVSSGDSGAAGCDPASATTGRQGRGVNGLCSSPYATCVGGTQFVEGSNQSTYWYSGSGSSTATTAIRYIPEAAWNESGASGGSRLWSTGGGVSQTFTKPAWQTGRGVPADGRRDVPDVSLTAAQHDAYTVVQGGSPAYLYGVSGTSASAPAWAGLVALLNQRMGAPQGHINPPLYTLATRQAAGGAAVFHDTTSGSNSVPGVTGFTAGVGYDLATGLGSVDAYVLANQWSTVSTASALIVSADAVSVNRGQSGATTVTTVANGLNSATSVSVSGAPAGVTATLAAGSVASPGSGTVGLTLAVGAGVATGSYTLTLTATCSGHTATGMVELTVTEPSFTLTSTTGASPSVSFGPGTPYASQAVTLRTAPVNGFNATIAFTASGLPSGMTVSFSPSTVAGGAAATSVATIAASGAVAPGSYTFTISGDGGGVTQTLTVRAAVIPPACQLAAAPAAVTVAPGGSVDTQMTCALSRGTFSGPLTVSFAGVPAGMTAQLSPSTLAPGSAGTLTLASAGGSATGRFTVSVTAAGSGYSQTIAVPVTVAPPSFTLAVSTTAPAIRLGGTTDFTVTSSLAGPFNAPVTLVMQGLPAGVTATYSPASLAAPGAGTVRITLRASYGVTPGTYLASVAGSGGGISALAKMKLTVSR